MTENTVVKESNLFPTAYRIERRFLNLPPVVLAEGIREEREARLGIQRLNLKFPKRRFALVRSAFVIQETTLEERGESSIFDHP